jgi:secondary thiamine-phosphate synthase enzyme
LSKLSAVSVARVETIATAVLSVETAGEGFFEITRDVARFLDTVKARDGAVLIYLQHTSASLVIQENADADVRTDLVTALRRLAPAHAGWVHEVEGPDDMPAHIKSMLNGVSLQAPVVQGRMARRIGARSCCNFSARLRRRNTTLVADNRRELAQIELHRGRRHVRIEQDGR